MRGDVVVQTATPRTCATTPVDCSPHDTFDPANAGSIAFLVNSKLADDCVSKLDFATRTAYLTKLKEGFSNNAGGTMDVKKATIRLLQFVALTDQQRQLNDYLANNNLHYWYVDNLSGEDLYSYAAIAGQRVYTFNTDRSDLPTANENRNFSSLSLGLFGNTNIAKIVNNKFEFTTYGKDYEHPSGSTYPLIQLWNNSVAANQYVYLHFEDNFTLAGFSFQKGINYPVPGVLAYAIFNKNKWNNVQAGTQIGFDVASLAFGVGELKALYSAANYASNTYKIYRLTKSFMDFGVTIGDVIISNNLTGSFTQAQQDRWNRFCFLYFTASLSAEGAEALIKWKGKTITKSSDFETMMDEVLAVSSAGNWMDNVFDLQKSVVNQNKNIIANMSSNHKGAWGEMASDAFLTEKGFQPLHPRKTALTDGWGETGIDGIFRKDGQYYIIEAKYTGQSTLNTTIDGKQLSKGWIEGSSRLENAVGETIAQDILQSGYKKIWAKVAPDGTITFEEATDNFATTFINFTP